MRAACRLMGKEEEWGRSAGQWEEEKGRLQQELERERADKAALQAEMAARPSKDEVVSEAGRTGKGGRALHLKQGGGPCLLDGCGWCWWWC